MCQMRAYTRTYVLVCAGACVFACVYLCLCCDNCVCVLFTSITWKWAFNTIIANYCLVFITFSSQHNIYGWCKSPAYFCCCNYYMVDRSTQHFLPPKINNFILRRMRMRLDEAKICHLKCTHRVSAVYILKGPSSHHLDQSAF